jgi:hypothetical protein
LSGTCAQIKCSITNVPGLNNTTTLPYAGTSTSLACESALGYSGSVNYTCTTNGAPANITGTCTKITCNVATNLTALASAGEWVTLNISTPNGANINQILFASYGTPNCSNFTTSSCHANAMGVANDTCLNRSSCSIVSSNNTFGDPCPGVGKWLCIRYQYPGAIKGINTTSVDIGSGSLSCSGSYTGSINYSCTGTSNPGTFAITSGSCSCQAGKYADANGDCQPIYCSLTGVAGLNNTTTLPYAGTSTSLACNASGYSGSVNYTCTTNGAPANITGACVEAPCTISSSTFPNLSSYSTVVATNTLTYIPCATGYYDAIKPKWEAVINRLSGEYNWQHTTRVFNAMANVNYTAAESNGGPTYNLGMCGLGDPMAHGTADCHCSKACDDHLASTKAAGLCNCDIERFALHFPSTSSSGLAYKCKAGVLLGSASCQPITCSVSANTGYTARTLNYGSGSFTCDAGGYSGTINYNCSAFNTPNLSGTCVSSTCTIAGVNGTSTVTVNKDTKGNGTCASGYTGYFSYNCDANGVGSITLNNCYTGRTFVEKTFSFNSTNQVGTAVVGGWWGYEWANNYVMQTPIDYVYATKTAFNLVFTWNCPSYGSYFWPNVFKRSGTGPSGSLASRGWADFPCCGYGPHTITATPQDIIGVNIANGDIIGFSNGGYTGCNSFDSSYNVTITYMANPSCTVGGSNGTVSQTVLGGSSGTNGTCASGYTGSYSWSCGINGQGSITANNCSLPVCNIPGTTSYNGLNGATGSGTIACNAGYTGSISYNCTAPNTPNLSGTCTPVCNIAGTTSYNGLNNATGSGTIACNSGYTDSISYNCTAPNTPNLSGTCTPVCNIAGTTSYNGLNNATGSGTIACNSGYTGSISYNCTAPNTPNLSGTCSPITCAISGTGYNARTLNYGSGSFTCDASGYSGTINYNCNAQNSPNLSGTCTYNGGSFTPNWYDSAHAPGGVSIFSNTANSVGMWGPNGTGGDTWGYYLANLPSWVTKVSFNWYYYPYDYGDYDRGYFFANGGWIFLASNNCTGCASSGTVTNHPITNTSDRRFGPGVWTKDGCCGAGQLTLSNIVFQ